MIRGVPVTKGPDGVFEVSHQEISDVSHAKLLEDGTEILDVQQATDTFTRAAAKHSSEVHMRKRKAGKLEELQAAPAAPVAKPLDSGNDAAASDDEDDVENLWHGFAFASSGSGQGSGSAAPASATGGYGQGQSRAVKRIRGSPGSKGGATSVGSRGHTSSANKRSRESDTTDTHINRALSSVADPWCIDMHNLAEAIKNAHRLTKRLPADEPQLDQLREKHAEWMAVANVRRKFNSFKERPSDSKKHSAFSVVAQELSMSTSLNLPSEMALLDLEVSAAALARAGRWSQAWMKFSVEALVPVVGEASVSKTQACFFEALWQEVEAGLSKNVPAALELLVASVCNQAAEHVHPEVVQKVQAVRLLLLANGIGDGTVNVDELEQAISSMTEARDALIVRCIVSRGRPDVGRAFLKVAHERLCHDPTRVFARASRALEELPRPSTFEGFRPVAASLLEYAAAVLALQSSDQRADGVATMYKHIGASVKGCILLVLHHMLQHGVADEPSPPVQFLAVVFAAGDVMTRLLSAGATLVEEVPLPSLGESGEEMSLPHLAKQTVVALNCLFARYQNAGVEWAPLCAGATHWLFVAAAVERGWRSFQQFELEAGEDVVTIVSTKKDNVQAQAVKELHGFVGALRVWSAVQNGLGLEPVITFIDAVHEEAEQAQAGGRGAQRMIMYIRQQSLGSLRGSHSSLMYLSLPSLSLCLSLLSLSGSLCACASLSLSLSLSVSVCMHASCMHACV